MPISKSSGQFPNRYGTVYLRTTRRRRVRQWRREQEAGGRSSEGEADFVDELEKEELLRVLGEEIQRLPEKYRAPIVLCYFEGRTHVEAARAIGIPRGSIAKRIGEGLDHLRKQLLRRGFVV